MEEPTATPLDFRISMGIRRRLDLELTPRSKPSAQRVQIHRWLEQVGEVVELLPEDGRRWRQYVTDLAVVASHWVERVQVSAGLGRFELAQLIDHVVEALREILDGLIGKRRNAERKCGDGDGDGSELLSPYGTMAGGA